LNGFHHDAFTYFIAQTNRAQIIYDSLFLGLVIKFVDSGIPFQSYSSTNS
jgi:hypothetical protein